MNDRDHLTAAEAAARLGVKRETLYAYVSRGILARTVDIDGRTSLFDPAQIDALRHDRRRPVKGEVPAVITSAITRLGEDGHAYRGVGAHELVAADRDFEAVAELLWSSDGGPIDDRHDWTCAGNDLATLRSVQASLPPTTPGLDRLRVTVATLSATDPLRDDTSSRGVVAATRRMLVGFAAALPAAHLGPRNRLADHLWSSLADAPGGEDQRRALNAALVLLADHGLATSTFAVRLAASTRADPYAMVSAGLGALGGPKHGTASDQVHRLLLQAEAHGPAAALGHELSAGRRLPGIGHVIYASTDRREAVLMDEIRAAWADDPRLEVALELRRLLLQRVPRPANIDFALGTLTWLAGMEAAGGVIFAVARTAGWVAHGLEELEEEALRFRPVARYIGPR